MNQEPKTTVRERAEVFAPGGHDGIWNTMADFATAERKLLVEKILYVLESRHINPTSGVLVMRKERLVSLLTNLLLESPPYPFGVNSEGKQCADWRKTQTGWHRNIGSIPLRDDAQFCEVCGAARKDS